MPQAETPIDLAVVYALGGVESDDVEAMPDAVQERVQAELEARNLSGAFLPAPASFRTLRDPGDRLEAVAGATSPVLLVSCDPRFEVQVNGRYRWSVPCDAGIGTELGHIEPSAHLVYEHQREAEAVVDVQTQLAREVGNVLDRWLASRQP